MEAVNGRLVGGVRNIRDAMYHVPVMAALLFILTHQIPDLVLLSKWPGIKTTIRAVAPCH